jgi:hypothetical protein
MKRIVLVTGALLVAGTLFWNPQHAHAGGMPAVVLNEIMWMGSSISSSDEWIELRNTMNTPVDITGWRITKLTSGVETPMLTISSGIIPAGGYFVIANDPAATSRLANEPQVVDAAISLVNSKLHITLYDAGGNLIDRADDGSGSPLAGEYKSGVAWKSMERNPLGADGTLKESWHTATASIGFDDALLELGTPGAQNSNQAPNIVATIPEDGTAGETIQFDASETTDAEGDSFTLAWSFGDHGVATGTTVSHQYTAAGSYTVTVTANDGQATSTYTAGISIVAAPSTPTTVTPGTRKPATGTSPTGTTGTSMLPAALQTSKMIRLNELLPNPDGSDEAGEFIEIINIGNEPIDLFGWKITDVKTDFLITTHLEVAPKSILSFPRSETKISLNNTGKETIFLVDPFGKIINGVSYEGAKAGKSFARSDTGDWRWTDPTPGAPNTFALQSESEKDANDTQEDTIPLRSIASIVSLELRTSVRLQGTVIVEPGILNKSFFYVHDGTAGIQIFSGSSLFPDVALGDVVEVTGRVGRADGESKLNVSEPSAVTVVESGDAIEPVPCSLKLPSGTLVFCEGTVSARRGTSVELETSQGTVKISFAASAGVSREPFTTGANIRVLGVWRVTKAGGRLYPRSDDDVEAFSPEVKGIETTEASEAPGEKQKGEEVILQQQRTPPASRMATVALWVVPAFVLGGVIVQRIRKKHHSHSHLPGDEFTH